jgi:hypothetical protein
MKKNKKIFNEQYHDVAKIMVFPDKKPKLCCSLEIQQAKLALRDYYNYNNILKFNAIFGSIWYSHRHDSWESISNAFQKIKQDN